MPPPAGTTNTIQPPEISEEMKLTMQIAMNPEFGVVLGVGILVDKLKDDKSKESQEASEEGTELGTSPSAPGMEPDGNNQNSKNSNNARNLTKKEQKSLNSYQKQIYEHQEKLREYKANPNLFDNKGYLKNAPNESIRQRIIEKRIQHLENEIKTLQRNIDKILTKGS
jgi:hypothetical protein